MPRFQKGQSGNPQGRPKGIKAKDTLREAIVNDIPGIIATLTEQARNGDVQAAKLLLDRAMPPLKPTDQPVLLPLDGDLADAGREALAAMGRGDLTPDQGTRVLGAVAILARVIESTELLARIERLEGLIHARTADETS